MKVEYRIIISCLVALVLVSCSKVQTSTSVELESSFRSLVSVDMNNFVRLFLDNNRDSSFQYGSDIFFIVENLSDENLFFDPNTFVRLYVIRDNKWLEVRNKRTYSGDILLLSKGTSLADYIYLKVRPVADTIPAIQDSNDLLRVVVIGEILRDDIRTGELVGAYVDVLIEQE